MNDSPLQPRATYDDDGNIILPGASPEPIAVPPAFPEQKETARPDRVDAADFVDDEEILEDDMTDSLPIPAPAAIAEEVVWVEVHEQGSEPTPIVSPAVLTRSRIKVLTHLSKDLMGEGVRQYVDTVQGSRPVIASLRERLRTVSSRAGSMLSQPVWIPGRKGNLKQYSRGTLFFVDIIRFGGTFAGIFAMLFLTLNFESFWQISEARLQAMFNGPAISLPQDEQQNINDTLVEEARKRGELLSYLPTVGPPEDRLIVPKLKLNVPLVTPSYESLLRQDWDQVEEDIQTALQAGVVHYPGTARPGQAGNFFVTGHSSYYPFAPGHYKTVFARLHELSPGDEYIVYFHGDRHRYIVRTTKEVLPSDVTVLDQPQNKRLSTLMTCTPIGTTLRRLIVQAEEVDLHTGIALDVGQQSEPNAVSKPQLEALPI